jgi:hypothetical protein
MWPRLSTLRCFYFAHLSRPATQRFVYQTIRRHGLRRIVELGVGNAERSVRMIEVAGGRAGAEGVMFTGIDLFELRTAEDGPGLSLKSAHRKLVATGAKIRLLPGDPFAALARSLNMLGTADLVLVSADQDQASLSRAWYFIERLLLERSHVLVEGPHDGKHEGPFRAVPLTEVRKLAGSMERRRAA